MERRQFIQICAASAAMAAVNGIAAYNAGLRFYTHARLVNYDGRKYRWKGCVGANSSIVAYSAICAHRLPYPTRQISFIRYYCNSVDPSIGRSNVIHCCAEHREYDAAQGARVVSGPAPQPLAAIILEHGKKTMNCSLPGHWAVSCSMVSFPSLTSSSAWNTVPGQKTWSPAMWSSPRSQTSVNNKCGVSMPPKAL